MMQQQVHPLCRRNRSAAAAARAASGAIGLGAALLSGCTPDTSSILVGTLAAADQFVADGAPLAVYATLAQKALVCWVGTKGPMKSSHIFHAEAAPPAAGGHAEIVLHDRDLASPHPWGPRAFRVELSPLGGGTNTQISMQNIKLPADLAGALRADVIDWAGGGDGCQAQVVRPPPADPPPPAAKAKRTRGRR